MKQTKLPKTSWMEIVLDAQLNIVEVVSPEQRILFGNRDVATFAGKPMKRLVTKTDNANQKQIQDLENGAAMAREENRSVYLEYTSFLSDGETIHAIAFIENDETFTYIRAIEIDADDLKRARSKHEESAPDRKNQIAPNTTNYTPSRKKYEHIYTQTDIILNSLPIGVEVYASDGTLIYLNAPDCRIFGVEKDTDLLGINIYNNPNLPDEVKNAVRDKMEVHTYFSYDFNVVSKTDYYATPQKSTFQIECNGRPIINADGKMDNYIFIVEDVTESIKAQEELRQSKLKNEMVMKAANIVFWEFDVETGIFVSENEPLNDFDKSKSLTFDDYIKALHPDDVLTAGPIIEDMFKGVDRPFSYEGRFSTLDGIEWEYCSVTCLPYKVGADGKVIRYVGARKNNTEIQKKKLLQDKILNTIPIPILIKDVENDFQYVFCNKEATRIFGIEEGGTAWGKFGDRLAKKMYQSDIEVHTTGKPYMGKERIALPSGRMYDGIIHKSIIYDGRKRMLLTICWDQNAERELERRSKVLSISMDVLNAYTWYYDVSTGQMSYGEGFENIRKDIGQIDSIEKFSQYIHPDDRQSFFEGMGKLMSEKCSDIAIEYRIDLLDNKKYEWWECRATLEEVERLDGIYQVLYGMNVNIDAHKKIELTLLKNKEEMSALIRQNELILNNTNSGLAYIAMDYIVQWENVSSCSTSLSYEAYKKGEPCYKSAHNRTSPCENCVLQRVRNSRKVELIKFPLNNHRIVEVVATPVFKYNSESEMEGIVIRVDDVTDRERMISELKNAKLQAEQSDKLKSAFLANMSHEIRTPLNAIVGFSDLLMNTEEGDEREEFMQIINTNNDLLLKLINDILDLSKIEAGSLDLKYEEFDLSEYFDGLVSSMQNRVQNPNVQLIADNPYSHCWVRLDKNRCAQILTNYVTNAIKYTPKGFIEMGYSATDEGIKFYVKDTGIGIAAEKRAKVFHRFEKLDEFAQGTGLGLSICKAIAKSMDGNVGFESEQNVGSMFWASLPCTVHFRTTAEDSTSISSREEEVAALVTKKADGMDQKTILVAEDIPSNFQLVSALLRKNYKLIHAKNGQEAVDVIKNCSVNLVLMDMKMPVMDGLTATAEIRKINPDIPIVALTAHAFDSDRLAAFAVGCNEYLVKPIDKTRLISILKRFC